MLSSSSPSIYQSPKCFVTYGSMGHTDTKQVSRKGKPWSNLAALSFIHKVDLIIPQDIYEAVRQQISSACSPPCYYKVAMSLDQILQGEFFTEYIKRGNILMLSEGRTNSDNMFMLKEGVLKMYLDKEAYESAGLVGKPHGVKGGRGLKPRWVVSYDLRSPSMLHGKKGFDRLVYASKKVFSQPVTWLFCNVEDNTPSHDPLQKYFPVKFTSSPHHVEGIVTKDVSIEVPQSTLAEGDRSDLETFTTELYEWLSLIRLGSPRSEATDIVDPYLSRYRAPEDASGKMALCRMSWQGFVNAEWLRKLLVTLLTTCSSRGWFSLSATEFATSMTNTGNELTLLCPPEKPGEYLMWDIQKSE